MSAKIEADLIAWTSDPFAKGDKAEAAKRIRAAYEAAASRLELTSLELTTLPECIGDLEHLEVLFLNCNNFQSLPHHLGKLVRLRVLDLNYNRRLGDLPLSLGHIPHLHICTGATAISEETYQKIQATRRSTPMILLPAKIDTTVETKDLLVSQRPLEVQAKIDEVYASLVKRGVPNWGRNGERGFYGLLGFSDAEVIAQRIKKAPNMKKDLYFIDLGAGKFTWVDEVKRYLQGEWGENRCRHFHVIGINGEGQPFDDQVTEGNITTHKISGFKLENLLESFQQFDLHLGNSVEWIVSSWTLRHLVDPLSVVEQAYHLLNAGNGFLFSTGFVCPSNGKMTTTLAAAFGIHNYIARKGEDFDSFALLRASDRAFSSAKKEFSYNEIDPLIALDQRHDTFAGYYANIRFTNPHEHSDVPFGGNFHGFGTYVLEQLTGISNLQQLRSHLDAIPISGYTLR